MKVARSRASCISIASERQPKMAPPPCIRTRRRFSSLTGEVSSFISSGSKMIMPKDEKATPPSVKRSNSYSLGTSKTCRPVLIRVVLCLVLVQGLLRASNLNTLGVVSGYLRSHDLSTQQRGAKQPQQSSSGNRGSLTTIKFLDTSWVTPRNFSIIVNETIDGQETLVEVKASNSGGIHSWARMKQAAKAANLPFQQPISPTTPSIITIDRIYYINLEKRKSRRAIMEAWLSKQSIPYQRVTALQGAPDLCAPYANGAACTGQSGLAKTCLHIIDNLNTTGLTLVVEDDFVIRDMERLMASIQFVPPDWDILRWDCWDSPYPNFKRYPLSYKVEWVNSTYCKAIQRPQNCWFCGGTHVGLWRGGKSLEKIRAVWSGPPFRPVDCRLSDPSIKTYCINIGVGEFHKALNEATDIPKKHHLIVSA